MRTWRKSLCFFFFLILCYYLYIQWRAHRYKIFWWNFLSRKFHGMYNRKVIRNVIRPHNEPLRNGRRQATSVVNRAKICKYAMILCACSRLRLIQLNFCLYIHTQIEFRSLVVWQHACDRSVLEIHTRMARAHTHTHPYLFSFMFFHNDRQFLRNGRSL